MTNWKNIFLENQKYLNPNILYVPFLKWLYIFNLPLANFFVFLKLKPSHITSLSNVFSLIAIYFLVFSNTEYLFGIFWIIALFLDICDGIVARMTNSSSALGSFYDHMSDQVKLIFLWFAVAYKYNDSITSIIAYTTNSMMLFYTVMNQMLAHRLFRLNTFKNKPNQMVQNKKRKLKSNQNETESNANKRNLGNIFINIFFKFYYSIFALQGNAMVFLIPLSFGKNFAIGTMIFYNVIILKSTISVIIQSINVNQALFQNKVAWK